MHDRQEPEGIEPTPYLPAWLDATPSHGNDHERGQDYGQYGGAEYGEQYGSPQYGSGEYAAPQNGQPQYGQPQYGAPPYGAPAAYGAPRHDGREYDDGPSPYEQLDRYEPYDYGGFQRQGGSIRQSDQQGSTGSTGSTPAIPASGQQFYPRRDARATPDERPSADLAPRDAGSSTGGAVVPTRGERRAARQAATRRGIGRPMLTLLVIAVLACAGVFGYWAFSYYEGEAPGVREGDCIAALGGTDIKPVDCSGPSAKFVVLEVFKGASDTTTCAVVLGATNPLVVKRDGRSDVWCVGPN